MGELYLYNRLSTESKIKALQVVIQRVKDLFSQEASLAAALPPEALEKAIDNRVTQLLSEVKFNGEGAIVKENLGYSKIFRDQISGGDPWEDLKILLDS